VATLSADFELPLRSFDLRLALDVERTVALVGPSGAGKSSVLRAIAGLVRPSGRIALDGEVWLDESTFRLPEDRRVGLVFQEYALFPHLTVERNVAFGGKARVGELLERFRISHLAHARPGELSGGERQRVALARALARDPGVLLLDEPLSALDAKVRVQLRDEIRRVQVEVGTTTLFVTHDQEEALAVADRVGVMNAGRLDQIAPPTELYARPATRFVAEFVGLSNRLRAELSDRGATLLGTRVSLLEGSLEQGTGAALVRPESLDVTPDGEANARVVSVAFLGPISRVQCRLDDGQLVIAQLASAAASRLAQDQPVRVDVRADAVLVVPD